MSNHMAVPVLGGVPVPLVGRGRLYVCGITPYETTHLGHAATFVWADVAARVLRITGAEVEVCRNITDVDDVLYRQAERDHTSSRSLAAQQTYRFEADMAALGVGRPAYEPHARDYVEDVVALATALLATGTAYERDGTVWFRGEHVPAAAGIGDDEARAALTAEAADHGWEPMAPYDVPVWQPARAGAPAWPSPWGAGRPGWHAECAAMALALLGPGVDVHSGGDDLTFPHHAYEAAMAEAATGVRPFARAWLRIGSVRRDGVRMAKSTGNLVLVHDLLERWEPEVIRLLLLDRRHGDPWDFDEGALDAAADRFDRLWGAAGRSSPNPEAARAGVRDALLDNLAVPRALDIAEAEGGAAARDLAGILGLVPSPLR